MSSVAPKSARALALLLLLSLAPWSPLAMPGVPAAAGADRAPPLRGHGPWNLTIFSTNDAHGAFLPEPASWRDDRAPVGGIAALAGHLARERRTAPVALLLDGGDFMTGNPICDIVDGGVRGAFWQDLLNLAGYDAGVIGNHEFDHGRDNALKLAARATFPLLAADILDETGQPLFRAAPVVIARGGLRVGVMGVSCAKLFGVTSPARTAGLSLRDQEVVVREQLADLLPRTDLQVLISHSGVEADKALARRLSGSGLDVIVGAHSHTRLNEPRLEGGILIVQAGSRLKQMSRLDLRVEGGAVSGYDGRLVELTADAASEAPPELRELADRLAVRIDKEYGQVIGTLVAPWRREGGGESDIGSWIADAMRARAGAEVAFLNSGGIRKDLPAGPIRLLDVHEILPFGNTLVTFEMCGADLRTLALSNARAAAHDDGVLQLSGLTFGWRRVGDHVEVEDLRVGGQPIEAERRYAVASADYVCLQMPADLGLPVPRFREVGVTVADAVADAIRQAGKISPPEGGRMRDVGAAGAEPGDGGGRPGS